MDLILNADDMASLSAVQKDAILEALFLALGIDREIQPDELARFDQEVARIPWGIEERVLRDLVQAARVRRKLVSGTENTLAWIRELANKLPNQTVKEKTLGTMARIALAHGLNRPERGLLNTFAANLGLPTERLEQIKAELTGQPAT